MIGLTQCSPTVINNTHELCALSLGNKCQQMAYPAACQILGRQPRKGAQPGALTAPSRVTSEGRGV
ncbi:hypothetical protein JYU34_008957 [Plutella xylostella]|uniref:Uncharacterized protein n=1 Tax=Plutella xylostella TaxID=51655 RepID=A0ABQ7QN35_PLUXY|nr:hypothetical protein JYU34_008957 [Plutella xylostella]